MSNHKTVLLVETEPIIAKAKRSVLKKHGFLVLTAASGEKAIKVVQNTEDLDIVLTDIDLGKGMDGTDAARAILEHRDIPVVFLIGNTDEDIVERTGGVRSFGYVGKGSEDAALVASINMAFRLHEAYLLLKEKERVLSTGKERSRKAQEIARVGNWEIDLRTNKIWASDEAFRIYGIEHETSELPLGLVQQIVLPLYRSRLDDALRRLIAQGGEYDEEFQIMRLDDGLLRFIHSRAELVLGDDGTPAIVAGVLQDITERKRTEEELRRSEHEKAVLNRVASVFLTVPDEEMYGEVLSVVLDVTQSRFGLFGFIADNGDLVIPSVTRDIWDQCRVPRKSVVFPPESWGNSVWGRALREQRVFHSSGPFHMPEGHIPIDQCLAAPIVFGGRSIGLIALANPEGGYTAQDKSLLATIVTSISPILDARLQRDRHEEERKRAEDSLYTSQLRLSEAMDMARLAYWEADETTGTFTLNDAFYDLIGTSAEREGGYTMDAEQYFRKFVHPDDLSTVYRFLERPRTTRDPDRSADLETRIVRPDGEVRHILSRQRVVRDMAGQSRKLFGTNQDITERKKSEEALRESESRFRGAFEAAGVGMALVALDGRFIEVNQSVCIMLGYPEKELLLKTFQDLTHPDDLENDLECVRRLIDDQIPYYRMEKRYYHRDGYVVWGALSVSLVRDFRGYPLYFVSQIEDITERKLLEEKLQTALITDALTGLYNRRGFFELASEQLRLENNKGHSLFFADLDHMKRINDTLGHREGDEALVTGARLLKDTFRESDIVGRIGGDEFAILAVGATEADRRFFCHACKITLTGSTGITAPVSLFP